MIEREDQQVHMIPIDQIRVLNPRSRGKVKFKQIVDNIGRIGLKRPVTVARLGDAEYLLVCGQGRLEAYKAHGETHIPAILIRGTKEDLLLMSLVENFARRRNSSVELVKEIRNLKERGHNLTQIAGKTDLAVPYVRGIIQLLNNGEERLVQAVEKGQIPISIAITIARSDDKAVQEALTEAYERNDLRGKQLLTARRVIENRRIKGKRINRGRSQNGSRISADEVLHTYQRETQRQRIIIQKAKICETRLVFAVSALQRLFEDENFINLLRAEELDTLPQFLAERFAEQGEVS